MTQAAALTQKDRGRFADRSFWFVCLAAGVTVLAVLAAILMSTLQQAWPAFSEAGENGFFTSNVWDPQAGTYGMLSLLYGTIIVSLIAVVLAVPVSIGIALFLTELAPRRVRAIIVTVIDMLASVPSVVFGLWGVITLAPLANDFFAWLNSSLGGIPIIGNVFGAVAPRSFALAGVILAVMIVPIITSITREVFDTVPDADKQAAWALGATRWEMIKGAVLPHSFGGIVGAVMLGLGRALGETIAVAMLIGASAQITANMFAPGYSIPAVIVLEFGESNVEQTAALIGMGVILFVLTVVINLLARVVVRRTELKMRGAA